jgi:hypothetical protein
MSTFRIKIFFIKKNNLVDLLAEHNTNQNSNNNEDKQDQMKSSNYANNFQQLTNRDIIMNINKKVNYSNSSSSTSQTNEDPSILLQLSPEHLILIRTILLLKYLAAKNKFKLAFKPYDFKDVIEQYTQGNMDIMLKMKDLQRKIEQVSTMAHQNSYNYSTFMSQQQGVVYGSGGSPVTQRSYSPNPNQFRRADSSSASFPINEVSRERGLKRNSSMRQRNWSNNACESNQQGGEDRLVKLELQISSLSTKIDALLSMSSNVNNKSNE